MTSYLLVCETDSKIILQITTWLQRNFTKQTPHTYTYKQHYTQHEPLQLEILHMYRFLVLLQVGLQSQVAEWCAGTTVLLHLVAKTVVP